MGVDALLEQLSQGEVQEGSRLTLDEIPNFRPVLLLHCLLSEGLDQVGVSGNVLDVAGCSLEDLVLLVMSTHFILDLNKLRLSVLDVGADVGGVLISKVVVVPFLLLILEG